MAKTKTKAPVAMQFKRPTAQARTKQKNKIKTVEIVRPWTTPQFEELSKEERDIVLDRLQKEVADVPTVRSHTIRGVSQVARAVAREDVRVVVFANNPESLAFSHVPLLCRLHQVPICVLHLSSKTFGKLFQLTSMVALGIKAPETSEEGQNAVEQSDEKESPNATANAATKTKLTEVEHMKLVSITNYLISKASKRT
ncbi:hypothetical protein PHMEG_000918 [Phytophthora megakarya]|uniref:Ribosomal protein eL8/eL30/eS12/Gadd45 domain-containing protein n=1 Tax=Phytophthora megakarya TaxID=4795 RepID=A0A225X445_9STRA|nr:hypothetical protein PHMEG_000918 [Phytophthora megakarya]